MGKNKEDSILVKHFLVEHNCSMQFGHPMFVVDGQLRNWSWVSSWRLLSIDTIELLLCMI